MGPFPFPILFQPQKNGGVLLLKMQRLQTGRLLILLTHQEATRLGLFDRDLSDQRYRLVCARLLGEACRRFRRFPLTGTVQARSVFLPGGEMLFWFLLPPARRFHLKHKYRYLCCHVPENDAFLSLWGRLCGNRVSMGRPTCITWQKNAVASLSTSTVFWLFLPPMWGVCQLPPS